MSVLEPGREGKPADDTCYADIAHLFGPYKRSKFTAEHEVLRACAEGPDACIGPGRKPGQ